MTNQDDAGRGRHAASDMHAHEDWDELAVGYALSSLEPDELERFIDHLVEFCPQCQRSVSDTEAVGAGLAAALPLIDPSETLRDSVLSAAFAARPAVTVPDDDLAPTPALQMSDGEGAGQTSAEVVDLSQRRSRRVSKLSPARAGWLVAAAAGLVAVVLAATTWAAVRDRDHQKSVAAGNQGALSSVLAASSQTVPLRTNKGDVVGMVVARPGSVSVMSEGIETNSPNTTYVLWGLNEGQSPIALGVFDVHSTTTQVMQVGVDSRGKYTSFDSFAVSREPGHTPPAKPSDVVALGRV